LQQLLVTGSLNHEQQQLLQQLLVTELDETLQKGFSKLRFVDTRRNGYLLLTVEADRVIANYYLVNPGELAEPLYDDPDALNAVFSTRRFVLQNGVISEISL
jgi:hypothetical protein